MADDPRRIALDIKDDIDTKAGYSNLALRANLAKAKLSRRDRALVTELVSGTLRRQGTLDWIISKLSRIPSIKLNSRIKNILRLALYQIWFTENIPNYAAINEAVEAAKASGGSASFVNGVLRSAIRKKDSLPWPDYNKNPAEFIAVNYSHPLWLVKRWLRDFGPVETKKICAADNQRPIITLRANFLNISRASLIEKLEDRGVVGLPGLYSEESIIIKGPMATGFDSSNFYVQNEASILVSKALNPKPGEIVIDLCSGPGGKTSHIGELMRNTGQILAVDMSEKRMNLVLKNCARLGVDIVEPKIADATEELNLIKADKVLLDAPCSGLGVLCRRPDLRWRRSERDIAILAKIQRKMLNRAAKYLKAGGLIIYSVCTNTPEETSEVVENFLKNNLNFKVEPLSDLAAPLELPKRLRFIQIQPYIPGLDGMFIAALRKLS